VKDTQPTQRLCDAGLLIRTGAKRGTRYHPPDTKDGP
jgi:hypothetical protein